MTLEALTVAGRGFVPVSEPWMSRSTGAIRVSSSMGVWCVCVCVSVCVCVGGYSDAFCGNWPHGTLPLRPAATAEEKKVDVTENPKTKKHLGASFP